MASDDRRWRLFLGPPVRFLAGPPPSRPDGTGAESSSARRPWTRAATWRRRAILAAIPLLAGGTAWRRVMPSVRVPTVIRLQHPTQPEAYALLSNPLRDLPAAERARDEREGLVLYQTNCRPCHGAAARGDGPLARGLRLRPVNFTDAGTIASVVESYPFWRIQRGHAELPDISTPWNSAMPAWGDELTDEEIWRIILAEYRLSGTEPRVPEGTDR